MICFYHNVHSSHHTTIPLFIFMVLICWLMTKPTQPDGNATYSDAWNSRHMAEANSLVVTRCRPQERNTFRFVASP